MTPPPRRPALIAAALAVLVIAGLVTVLVTRGREGAEGSESARIDAERYLELLADETRDPAALADLLPNGDPEALERAGALLALARTRINDPTLGPAEQVDTARGESLLATDDDVVFDRFERFDVTYDLAGEPHRSTITLGLPRSGTDEDWLVVRPLSGAADWNSAAWRGIPLDLLVGEVELTDPDRTSYEPDAQFVHPAVYPVQAAVGRWYRATEVDVTVPGADGEVVPLPEFDLAPTAAGRSAVTDRVLAAFEPCERGTTLCPVLELVRPRDGDLRPGWWRGLTSDPTVAVDGLDVTLRDGEFSYRSPTGREAVPFVGSTSVRIDPVTRRLDITVPLTIARP